MGNITVYFVSYFRYVKGYTEVDEDTFYAIQPLIVMVATLLFPVGNKLVDKFGG